MTDETIEATIFGAFLALYCGLSAEGTARARECLAGFANDPDAYPEERNFYLWALEQIASVHNRNEDDEPPRPQLRPIKGGVA